MINSALIGGITPFNPSGLIGGGGDDPPIDTIGKEMQALYKRKLKYDNKTAKQLMKDVATKTGVNPAMLFSSSFQEGMNKFVNNPDEIEKTLQKDGWYNKDFPISGYQTYGLDTFGSRADEFMKKGYLPADFKSRYNAYEVENDHMKKDPKTGKWVPDPQVVMTADFKTNEDALMAKAAFFRAEADSVKDYAKQRGITLDDDSLNYFTLASYNSGIDNTKGMLDEYAKAKDKKRYIKEGLTKYKQTHKNISPRLANMLVAKKLLDEMDE